MNSLTPLTNAVKVFLSRYSFAIIWMGTIIGVGIIFSFIVQQNSAAPLVPTRTLPVAPGISRPLPPPPPTVTLTIKTGKKGNTLVIQWSNLPANTTAIDIYRGLSVKPTSTWALFKHLAISPGDLANGTAEIDIGKSGLEGFSFYIQAVTSGPANASGTTNESSTVLFTSGIIVPSTNPIPPPPPPPPPPTDSQPSNPTTTTQAPPPPSNSTTSQATTTPTPSGTPYYNPQIQISGYGPAIDAQFYAQHVDRRIQLGWQKLPPNTTRIVIYRSPAGSGPWVDVLAQTIANTGAYSIQVADNTVGAPYYYEMTAFNGTSSIATYGPVFLAAQ